MNLMLLESFINGVEVLDKSEITEPALLGIIIGVVIGIIANFILVYFTDSEFLGWFVGAILCLVVMAISIHPTGKYEYKVIITDEVSLNEFNEKYEITDQEGKIYTIRFKE